MTRFAALICFALCALMPPPGQAQDSGTADRCFPWQEFRNGICAAKPAPVTPAPAMQAPLPPDQPERSQTAVAPACPAGTHLDDLGTSCVADIQAPPIPPPLAPITITCNGGTAGNGQCTCPAGFELMPAGTEPGGTCVRTNADNCVGGQMTVAGECLCNGQVTMSGQVYDLEFSRSKCVPKRCPRDGPCASAAAKPEHDTSPRLSSDETEQHPACARGMVATRHGCVPARHRSHAFNPGAYFRNQPGATSY
ncbi:hypothetical protein [Bradyrhizobium sp.]|uniref:hypothetical protein n=1 Tax=Bradyrhizobium sp. TaxID=376 RepID=UPI0039E6CD35